MKKLNNCVLCKSKNIKFFFNQKDKSLNTSFSKDFFACNDCELIFQNPFPSQKETLEYYPPKDYYSLSKIDSNSKKSQQRIKIYGSHLRKTWNPFLLISRSFFRGVPPKDKKKILDIGCGSGQFLYEAQILGFNCEGIESGQTGEQKELKIKNMDFLKNDYKENSFDAIIANHVLEHLSNPYKFVKELERILKPKGIAIIGIPNTNSLAFKIFKKNWYQIDSPRHLINYNNKNILRLFEESKWKIEKIRFNSRPSQFSASILYLLNLRKGGKLEKILNVLFLPLSYLANILKFGDQIEVYYIKK